MICITCHRKLTPADRVLDQLNKACSFSKSSNSWSPSRRSCWYLLMLQQGSLWLSRPFQKETAYSPQSQTHDRRSRCHIGATDLPGKDQWSWCGRAHLLPTSVKSGIRLPTTAPLTLSPIILGLQAASHSVCLHVLPNKRIKWKISCYSCSKRVKTPFCSLDFFTTFSSLFLFSFPFWLSD